MTETDATRRPLGMPERYIPYLDRYRLFLLFKLESLKTKDFACHTILQEVDKDVPPENIFDDLDNIESQKEISRWMGAHFLYFFAHPQEMMTELIIALPKDHLKFMKRHIVRFKNSSKDVDRIIMLVSPELRETLDVTKLAREIVKNMGFFVITRRLIMDRYEKHDDYVQGCISPVLLADVAKLLALKDHVQSTGWFMFDHPCTFREARCLQQAGVLPTVTLALTPTPSPAPPAHDARTPRRTFFTQDFEALQFAYKATLKEVHIYEGSSLEEVAERCINAIRAAASGAQGPGQGFNVVGAPGVYRVLLIGPRGSGRRTQARMLASHFGLVCLNYPNMLREAMAQNDEIGEKLRKYGESFHLKTEIVRRRLLRKDCIDHGWVMTGYPLTGDEFETIDNMPTPPNRVIFLNVDWATCKRRAVSVGVDWCTGKRMPVGSGPRVVPHPGLVESEIDAELDLYFTESLAELRAAAGMTADEVNAIDISIEEIQTKIQAAVIAAPLYNIEPYQPLKNRDLRVG